MYSTAFHTKTKLVMLHMSALSGLVVIIMFDSQDDVFFSECKQILAVGTHERNPLKNSM